MNTFEFIKAVSDTVLDKINTAHHFILYQACNVYRATFRKKFVSHHQATKRT